MPVPSEPQLEYAQVRRASPAPWWLYVAAAVGAVPGLLFVLVSAVILWTNLRGRFDFGGPEVVVTGLGLGMAMLVMEWRVIRRRCMVSCPIAGAVLLMMGIGLGTAVCRDPKGGPVIIGAAISVALLSAGGAQVLYALKRAG